MGDVMPEKKPIGILDSGVGGLSVLRHIQALMPNENLIYFADQVNIPYGPRPPAEIRRFSEEITRFLLRQGSKVIVVACNTASAATLEHLRSAFPNISFVGMEPAVKPGVHQSRQGKIGILATAGTFGSRRYANLMARYAQGVVAFEDPCLGLVEQIEAGKLSTQVTDRILRDTLAPMLNAGVDTLVLGCTHYPFVLPSIRRLAGPGVNVIDPAPAVALQVQRVLRQQHLLTEETALGDVHGYTTGDARNLELSVEQLLSQFFPISPIEWGGKDGRSLY